MKISWIFLNTSPCRAMDSSDVSLAIRRARRNNAKSRGAHFINAHQCSGPLGLVFLVSQAPVGGT